MNGQNGQRAMVPAQQAAQMQVSGETAMPAEIKTMMQVDPEIGKRAFAIMAMQKVDDWHPPLHPARAIAAALHEIKTGQVCGIDFLARQYDGRGDGLQGQGQGGQQPGYH